MSYIKVWLEDDNNDNNLTITIAQLFLRNRQANNINKQKTPFSVFLVIETGDLDLGQPKSL